MSLLCLLAAAVCGVVYLISPWLNSQLLGKQDPRIRLVPVELPIKAEAPLSNAIINGHSFSFHLPIQEVASTTEGAHITLVHFPNGMLTIHDPLDNKNWIAFQLVHSNDKQVEGILGPEIINSKFKLMQAAMAETPEHVKWWRFRSSENQRAELLLWVKFTVLLNCSFFQPPEIRHIYAINFGKFRGFQYGNPVLPPYDTYIDIFDEDDQHFTFEVRGPSGHKQVLTQEEINAVIASIRSTSSH